MTLFIFSILYLYSLQSTSVFFKFLHLRRNILSLWLWSLEISVVSSAVYRWNYACVGIRLWPYYLTSELNSFSADLQLREIWLGFSDNSPSRSNSWHVVEFSIFSHSKPREPHLLPGAWTISIWLLLCSTFLFTEALGLSSCSEPPLSHLVLVPPTSTPRSQVFCHKELLRNNMEKILNRQRIVLLPVESQLLSGQNSRSDH